MDADSLLALARALEVDDERVAGAIAEVATLEAEAVAVGSRASELGERLERLPAELTAAEAALADAEADEARKRETLERAEQELGVAERAGKEERLAASRREAVRARDALSAAQKRVGRARETRAGLGREADAAALEAQQLERRARELAGKMRGLERISAGAAADPERGLRGVAGWASRARAALFVVRGGLETERERIVREANELYASALGEPVGATTVALVRRRLEGRN